MPINRCGKLNWYDSVVQNDEQLEMRWLGKIEIAKNIETENTFFLRDEAEYTHI